MDAVPRGTLNRTERDKLCEIHGDARGAGQTAGLPYSDRQSAGGRISQGALHRLHKAERSNLRWRLKLGAKQGEIPGLFTGGKAAFPILWDQEYCGRKAIRDVHYLRLL